MQSDDKIVITGASGLLGSAIVEALCGDARLSVFALTSRPEKLLPYGRSNISVIENVSLLSHGGLLEGAVVIHCAFPRNSSGESVAEGLAYTRDIIETSCRCKAAAIINISSQSVYSQNRTEIADEGTRLCLESSYAVGKYAMELFTESYCNLYSVKHTSIRLASLIGPALEQRIVNRLIKDVVSQKEIVITDSKRTFGFLDVRDAAAALIALAARKDAAWEGIYTLGNGKAYTVKEIYKTVELLAQEHQIKPGPVVFKAAEEENTSAVSGEKLSRLTGYSYRYSLKQSAAYILQNVLSKLKEEANEHTNR